MPAIPNSSYESLRQSIKEKGLHVPIVVNQDGVVLDGHHRFKACKELGVPLQFHRKKFDDELDEKQFAIEINLERPQLNDFQKIELVYALEHIESEKAKKRMTVGGHLAGGSNSIPGDGSNNQQQRVASIDATLEPGERNHIRAQEKRQNLIREVQKAVSGSQPNKESASRIKLIASDFQAIDNSSILDKSVDLILTEPPYSREWLPFHEPLGKLASRVLKEGGSFVMYAGHHSLPEVLDYIKKSGLNYWWEIAAKLNGPSRPAQHHQVYVMWRPLLWFVKGNRLRVLDCVPDLIESRPPNEEYTLEGEHVISKLTAQDDVVLDPLMGVGTTGITALRLKRRFIGIEKDQVTFALAKARIDMELSFHRTT